MKDHPILFSAPMIKALLASTKTQTRRKIPQPEVLPGGQWHIPWQVGGGCFYSAEASDAELAGEMLNGLRIESGDRLWVREAWHAARSLNRTPPRDIPLDADIEHAATARSYAEIGLKGKLRPGIHMPRWASRLTLIVTDVRVQRLQEISAEDAIAEGVVDTGRRDGAPYSHFTAPGVRGIVIEHEPEPVYAQLWEIINGEGSWNANPWVAAYSFEVHHQNIDQMEHAA